MAELLKNMISKWNEKLRIWIQLIWKRSQRTGILQLYAVLYLERETDQNKELQRNTSLGHLDIWYKVYKSSLLERTNLYVNEVLVVLLSFYADLEKANQPGTIFFCTEVNNV